MNLYLKLFIGFWLCNIVIVSGVLMVSYYLPAKDNAANYIASDTLFLQSSEILRTKGINGIRQWSQSLPEHHNVYFLNQGGKNLVKEDKVLPNIAQTSQLYRISPEQGLVTVNAGQRRYLGRAIFDNSSKKTFQLVTGAPNPPDLFQSNLENNLWPKLLTALLLSVWLCYLLARYFTVPIKQLRVGAREVADGKYDVRIAERIGKGNDELDLLAREFDQMASTVQQTLENQQRLIKDVSHELRTPLTRLQLALGLAQQRVQQAPALLDDSTENEISMALQRVESEVQVLDELIEQILSLPQQNLELTDALDVAGLLEHCIQLYVDDAKKRNVNISFANQVPEAIVRSRGRLLNVVFENIIKNALRYAPKGSAIKVSLDTSTLSSADTAKTGDITAVKITIADSGPGVKAEQLPHLFEPFYRASAARDRDSGGYGLGLAIAERSVRLHHGHIGAVDNAPGLRVEVVLPVVIEASDGKAD